MTKVSGPSLRWHSVAPLVVILLLALGVRLPGLADRGPWLDERLSLNTAVGSAAEEPAATGSLTPADLWAGNSPASVHRANLLSDGVNGLPYHFALHGWIRAFGISATAVRSLSLLLGMGIVVLTWAITKELFGTNIGLLTGVICSVHPLLVVLSQELRPYAFAIVTLLCSTLAAIVFSRSANSTGPRRWLLGSACGILPALGFMSHYSSAALVGAHVIVLLVLTRRPGLRATATGGLLLFAGLILTWYFVLDGREGLAFFAALSEGRRQALEAGDPRWWWLHRPTPRYLLAGAGGVVLSILGSNLQSYLRITYLVPLIGVPALYFGWARAAAPQRALTVPYLASITLVVGSGLLLAVIASLRSGHDTALVNRYFAFFVPYALPLFAMGMVEGWRRGPLARTVVGIHALLLVASLGAAVHQLTTTLRRNVYAELARGISREEPRAMSATYPNWMDARTVSLYLRPESQLVQKVDSSLRDEVEVRGRGGRLLLKLPIDRARAR